MYNMGILSLVKNPVLYPLDGRTDAPAPSSKKWCVLSMKLLTNVASVRINQAVIVGYV